MFSIATEKPAAVTANPSPRYFQRRAGDDKAANPHRRAVGSFDPLAATAGVSSSHYKRRVADDKAILATAAAATLAAMPPPPIAPDVTEVPRDVDQATPELRRRIFAVIEAEPRKRGAHKHLSQSVAWSIAAGLSIPLLGLGGLIFAL